mgnify:CR=1 FL=1
MKRFKVHYMTLGQGIHIITFTVQKLARFSNY